jgi:cytochrome oxidase Cu insertion factor (SCO1/SenC/PrrC family)
LVKEYANKDIEFVSISIDSKNDYEKWRKMVPEKNVGGIQLYDTEGLNSDFMKAFSVSLIPRFMMIDSEGKIITAKAPRPSSEDVRNFIDSHLDKPKIMKFTSS